VLVCWCASTQCVGSATPTASTPLVISLRVCMCACAYVLHISIYECNISTHNHTYLPLKYFALLHRGWAEGSVHVVARVVVVRSPSRSCSTRFKFCVCVCVCVCVCLCARTYSCVHVTHLRSHVAWRTNARIHDTRTQTRAYPHTKGHPSVSASSLTPSVSLI